MTCPSGRGIGRRPAGRAGSKASRTLAPSMNGRICIRQVQPGPASPVSASAGPIAPPDCDVYAEAKCFLASWNASMAIPICRRLLPHCRRRALAGGLHGRQQQRYEHADNRNHDQQFNQRKRSTSPPHRSIPSRMKKWRAKKGVPDSPVTQ